MIAFKPGKNLCSHVDTLWVTDGPLRENLAFEYYPVATSDLLFALSENQCQIFLCGAATEQGTVMTSPGKTYFALRFRPGMAADLFGSQQTAITNATTELNDLFGMSTDVWGEKLHQAATPVEQAAFLFRTLLGQNLNAAELTRGQAAARRIAATGGGRAIHDIAGDMHSSTRQLERQIKTLTGLTPKSLARMVRLQRTFTLLHHNRFSSLTTLALNLGYMDQSHFIRDFKCMTQKTPGEFLMETRFAAHVTTVSAPPAMMRHPIYRF